MPAALHRPEPRQAGRLRLAGLIAPTDLKLAEVVEAIADEFGNHHGAARRLQMTVGDLRSWIRGQPAADREKISQATEQARGCRVADAERVVLLALRDADKDRALEAAKLVLRYLGAPYGWQQQPAATVNVDARSIQVGTGDPDQEQPATLAAQCEALRLHLARTGGGANIRTNLSQLLASDNCQVQPVIDVTPSAAGSNGEQAK